MAFLPPLLPTRLPALPTCLLHTPLTSLSPHFPICLPSRPICPTFSIFFTSIPFSFSSCLFSVSSLILVFDVSVHRLRPRFMILASPLSSFCPRFVPVMFLFLALRSSLSSSRTLLPVLCPRPRHRPLSSFRILCPEPSSSSSCPLVPFLLVPILVHHLLPARQEREALLK